MRDIRFRAWNNITLRMVAVRSIHFDTGNNMCAVISCNCQLDHTVPDERIPSFILMHYTGLKDKNGKEIYEGDILDSETQPKPFAVTADDYHGLRFKLGDSFLCRADALSGKVIGNIHQNPKLLTERNTNEPE